MLIFLLRSISLMLSMFAMKLIQSNCSDITALGWMGISVLLVCTDFSILKISSLKTFFGLAFISFFKIRFLTYFEDSEDDGAPV